MAGDLRVCLRFLTRSNATTDEMATVRELVENENKQTTLFHGETTNMIRILWDKETAKSQPGEGARRAPTVYLRGTIVGASPEFKELEGNRVRLWNDAQPEVLESCVGQLTEVETEFTDFSKAQNSEVETWTLTNTEVLKVLTDAERKAARNELSLNQAKHFLAKGARVVGAGARAVVIENTSTDIAPDGELSPEGPAPVAAAADPGDFGAAS